jgi:signal-transduction protein with cAMP-binding, CBS, and nucleotidyltransferase domain
MGTVSEVMATDVQWIRKDLWVHSAAAHMADRRIGSLLVMDEEGAPAGIVTETDMVRRVIAADRNPMVTQIADIMTPSLITIDEQVSMSEASDLMAERSIRHVVVTREGMIVGVVSIRDLIAREDFLPFEVERMMSRAPVVVALDDTVRNAAAQMANASVSGVLVAGRRRSPRQMDLTGFARRDIAGIVTGTDLVRKVVARERYPYVTEVADVMVAPLQTIGAHGSVNTALDLMDRVGVRHLAVTEGDEIVGVLAAEDIFDPAWLQVASRPLRKG